VNINNLIPPPCEIHENNETVETNGETNEKVFNSLNNLNNTNNLINPCYGGDETIGRKAAKQSRPFSLFVLPGSAGKRWTASPLFSPRESVRLSASLSSSKTHRTSNLCRMNRLINEA
jgi:hypothetical protein